MSARPATPNATTLAAFLGAVAIGGANFVAVKFSNEELEPLFGAGIRFAIAGAVFLAIAYARRLQLPRGRAAIGAVIYGVLGFGLAYGLLYFALVGLKAGTASLILAAVPLATLTLAVWRRQERFSLAGVLGGALAVAGVLVLSAGSIGGDVRPIYVVAAVLGTFAVAGSSVAIKGYPQAHPITSNVIGMPVGAALLLIASVAFREEWTVPATARTWLVLSWLVVMGSVVLFMLFLFVIQSWTASATTYALALMPVVAVALGAALADEAVTLETVFGGGLVLAAVYIGALRREKPVTAARLPECGGTAAERAAEPVAEPVGEPAPG